MLLVVARMLLCRQYWRLSYHRRQFSFLLDLGLTREEGYMMLDELHLKVPIPCEIIIMPSPTPTLDTAKALRVRLSEGEDQPPFKPDFLIIEETFQQG